MESIPVLPSLDPFSKVDIVPKLNLVKSHNVFNPLTLISLRVIRSSLYRLNIAFALFSPRNNFNICRIDKDLVSGFGIKSDKVTLNL